MYARITLIGRLGKKPEKMMTKSGHDLVTLSIATSEKKDETSWWSLSVFGKVGDYAANYLDKGDLCYVEATAENIKKDIEGKAIYQPRFTVSTIRRLSKKGQEHGALEQADQQTEPSGQGSGVKDFDFSSIPF